MECFLEGAWANLDVEPMKASYVVDICGLVLITREKVAEKCLQIQPFKDEFLPDYVTSQPQGYCNSIYPIASQPCTTSVDHVLTHQNMLVSTLDPQDNSVYIFHLVGVQPNNHFCWSSKDGTYFIKSLLLPWQYNPTLKRPLGNRQISLIVHLKGNH